MIGFKDIIKMMKNKDGVYILQKTEICKSLLCNFFLVSLEILKETNQSENIVITKIIK